MANLLDKLKAKRKITLQFVGEHIAKVAQTPDASGKTPTIFTFTLSEPIDVVGSTTYTDLTNMKEGVRTEAFGATTVSISEDDFAKAEEGFSTEEDDDGNIVVTGYEGTGLVLDVAKPKFNRFSGAKQKNEGVWLRTVKFADAPRLSVNSSLGMS